MYWECAIVAALFAIHPQHVESVAWISSRKDVLSTLLWLLTMWAYLSYVKHPKISRYILVAILLSLGLLAKTMLITLPFVLLLLDWWPLERLKNAPEEARARIRRAGILVARIPVQERRCSGKGRDPTQP